MNKEPWGGFQPVAHTYIKQHTDYEGNVMFSVPTAIAEGAAAKINFALSTAKPYEFYTFDADGDYTVHIIGGCHDVPGNYGFTLTVGDAIMIDGKVVTREDVRRMRLELDVPTVARDTLDGIVSENIARRCEIEQHLMNVATGKAPLLTEQDCRILALRLGTPKAQWNATIKNYKFGGLQ